MPKIILVKSARVTPSPEKRRCVRCGHTIQPGESYRHAGFKTGPRSSFVRYWCSQHSPRASEQTANERLATLYGAQESIEDEIAAFRRGKLDSVDSLVTTLNMAADEAEIVGDSYEEGADALPENLQQGSQAEEMRTKAEAIKEWADTLREAAIEIESDAPDKDDCSECGADSESPVHIDIDQGEGEEAYDHDFEAPSFADVLAKAEEAANELSI